MPYEIKGPSRDGIWTVVYTGELDLHTRQEAMGVGLSVSRGKYLRGLIVDLRDARMKMSTMDMHNFAKKKNDQQELEQVKVAFVHKDDENDNEFVVQMMRSSGRAAASFTKIEDAHAWLLDSP